MIDFNLLYERVKANKEAHAYLTALSGELIEYIIRNEELKRLKTNDFDKSPGLGLQLTRTCFNNCRNCCSPTTGEYMDLNQVYPLLDKVSVLTLYGGEALLHPEFKTLLDNYVSSNNSPKSIVLFTGGLNPKADRDVKEVYYNNLEDLVRTSNLADSTVLKISYNSGSNLNSRILGFLMKYAEYSKKYTARNIGAMLRIIYEDEKDFESKKKSFREAFEKHGLPVSVAEHFLKTVQKGKLLKLNSENNFNYTTKCHISNDLFFNVNGCLSPCFSVHNDLKPLPAIAHASEPFETIMDKRNIFWGFIRILNRRFDSCVACVEDVPKALQTLMDKPSLIDDITWKDEE
ncbi:MAG: hypothetical protein JW791_01520 [Nanoarchaeota archaeon]|nr:hypothetical protein [Nanoarchaeota archaeon]